MRIMITGISGFVAQHFLHYLYENDVEAEVFGLDISVPRYDVSKFSPKLKITFQTIDMLDSLAVRGAVFLFKPEYIIHLASYSSVAYSWKHPGDSFINNTNIFLNLMEAVEYSDLKCRILSVGSSEEYGNVTDDMIPLKETDMLNPVSPYAIARVSQEMYSQSYGFDIIMTRSFNHIGPHQDVRFAIPSFVKRIREIKISGHDRGTIETGDLSVIRDFTDVRDVVRAYHMLLMKGKKSEVYNVCSEKGVKLSEIIDMIAQELGVHVDCVVNQDLVRPNECRIIIGSNRKIKEEIGWTPEIQLADTIKELVQE